MPSLPTLACAAMYKVKTTTCDMNMKRQCKTKTKIRG